MIQTALTVGEYEMTTHILTILGAAYGPRDVTGTIRDSISNQGLSVTADNNAFGGDPWPGVLKTLVVVYQYNRNPAAVAYVPEGNTLTITPPPPHESAPKSLFDPQSLEKIGDTVTRSQASQTTLTILGAVFGLTDVTTEATSLVQDGEFNATANDATWGDGWPGHPKTLVVVYQYTGAVSMLNVVKENEQMHFIVSPPMRILGATWGPAPKTGKVDSLAKNRALNVVANNDTFGPDPFHGHAKSLVVIYQYGEERPIVAIAAEGSALNIIYTPGGGDYIAPADPASLTILGAAYGLGNVTGATQELVKANQLNITANNETFGDSWHNTVKTFTLVYQYGRNPPLMKAVTENTQVSVQKIVPPQYVGQILSKDLLDTGDVVSLSASNNMFIASDTNGKLVAAKDVPDTTTGFTVQRNTEDSTVSFKTSAGKYIVVGPNKFLQATGSQSQAARFIVSLSTDAGIVLASAETQEYARLFSDGQSITVDAVDNFSLSTSFGIAFQSTSISSILERRGISAVEMETLTPCEIAWLSFVWHLTGGFFLAVGAGPFITSGTPNPGLLALIKSNPQAWKAVSELVTLLQQPIGVTAQVASLIGTIGVLYHEGILWDVLKILLKAGGWYILTIVLAKALALLLVPEVEAANLLANFTVWAVMTVPAALHVNSACN